MHYLYAVDTTLKELYQQTERNYALGHAVARGAGVVLPPDDAGDRLSKFGELWVGTFAFRGTSEAAEDEEDLDYDSGVFERTLESKLPEFKQQLRLTIDATVYCLALNFEIARRARIDLAYPSSLLEQQRQVLYALLSETFPGNGASAGRRLAPPAVRGLALDALKRLLLCLRTASSFCNGLLLDLAKRGGWELTPHQVLEARRFDWKLRAKVESDLEDRPGTCRWVGREAERLPAGPCRAVVHERLRALLAEMFDAVDFDASLSVELAQARLVRVRVRRPGARFRKRLRRWLTRPSPERSEAELEVSSPDLELLLRYLSRQPEENFRLVLAVARGLGVVLPYDDEMTLAWDHVHHRLLRRSLCYRPDEIGKPGQYRAVDSRWLARLLQMLIDASSFTLCLVLQVARRAEVKLPHKCDVVAERKRRLYRLLEEALPPVAQGASKRVAGGNGS